MSKLPALKPREIIAALKRAGFVEHHQRGSHLHLWHETRKRMATVPVHPGDVKRGTMNAIIRQAGMTAEEFQSLL